MTTERRKFHRILFDAPVMINQQSELQSTVVDISLNGVLIQTIEEWQCKPGDAAEISIFLDAEQATTITMRVNVAHIDNGRVGLRCKDIDMESIAHLRRLVELNLGDAELLERELEALG
ncbi:MAG: PilZ domain-containing protein [Chromatiales bacterium]|nr:PilZ domain-containing protein [Chromatiales bacterium]